MNKIFAVISATAVFLLSPALIQSVSAASLDDFFNDVGAGNRREDRRLDRRDGFFDDRGNFVAFNDNFFFDDNGNFRREDRRFDRRDGFFDNRGDFIAFDDNFFFDDNRNFRHDNRRFDDFFFSNRTGNKSLESDLDNFLADVQAPGRNRSSDFFFDDFNRFSSKSCIRTVRVCSTSVNCRLVRVK